jgi:hypothetical protein
MTSFAREIARIRLIRACAAGELGPSLLNQKSF